jgi:hypothetical protein
MRTVRERTLMVVIGLAVGFTACSKSARPPESPPPVTGVQASMGATNPATQLSPRPVITAGFESDGKKPKGRIDACTLLSSKEIQSIQGEPLKETKSNAKVEGGFGVSQCFYTLPTFTNSISLVVTQRGDGPGARDPKEFWREHFSNFDTDSEVRERNGDKDHDKDREKGRAEEDEESAKALKISHVGDEAFWSGNAVGGALYVLKGNAFIRVSIGGSGAQRVQIKKARALAQTVLKHL